MRTMRVRDVMTRRVVAVTPNTPFRDLAEMMLHHEIGAIPVIDDTGDLIGLITEADLITKQAYGDRRRHLLGGLPGVAEHEARGMLRSRAHTAREVMSAPVETALPGDPLRDVARRMIENRLRHLVVVDGDRRMVGIVSRRDLLRVFDRTDDEIAAEVRIDLARSGHLAGGDVSVAVDGGLVTLDGRIRELAEIPVMCRLAWLVPGVVDVVHHLTVTPAWGTTAVEPAEAPVARPGPPAES
jgi:CBS domain-containing protein